MRFRLRTLLLMALLVAVFLCLISPFAPEIERAMLDWLRPPTKKGGGSVIIHQKPSPEATKLLVYPLEDAGFPTPSSRQSGSD